MKLHLPRTGEGFISSSKKSTMKHKHKTQAEPTARKAQKSTKELMILKKVSNTVSFLELNSNLLLWSHVLPLGRIPDKVLETETPALSSELLFKHLNVLHIATPCTSMFRS